MGRFNFKSETDFEKVRSEAEAFYDAIGTVYCPYFKQAVVFNAKGLRHLKFKSDKQIRSSQDQYGRLKLIRYAPEILKLSHTVQGAWLTRHFENQKTNSRWEQIVKDVTYYEFVAVLDRIRLRVIVKEVHGGEKHFWSVIPFWGIDKNSHQRILHSGNPKND